MKFPNEFGGLLLDLISRYECAFTTIPSVFFEFTRGSQTIEDYNKRVSFLKNISNVYPIEKHQHQFEEAVPVFQKVADKNLSYTDFLLCMCLYHFRARSPFLFTQDNRHMPLDILDRTDLITIDSGEIQSIGIYQFSEDKFKMAAENILR